MSKYFNGQFTAKVILVACCLALIDRRSNALFLGNFIGCNSFGCRIAALEQDVGQLKQQVMRLGGGGGNGMNYQQPNTMPYNPNQMGMNQQGMNNQQLPNQFNQNGQQMNGQQGVQPQQGQQGSTPNTRQNAYANIPGEYPPELRRTQGVPYQNPLTGQFMSA